MDHPPEKMELFSVVGELVRNSQHNGVASSPAEDLDQDDLIELTPAELAVKRQDGPRVRDRKECGVGIISLLGHVAPVDVFMNLLQSRPPELIGLLLLVLLGDCCISVPSAVIFF
jgi:hypothetical protein